jgi:hypothetical protein
MLYFNLHTDNSERLPDPKPDTTQTVEPLRILLAPISQRDIRHIETFSAPVLQRHFVEVVAFRGDVEARRVVLEVATQEARRVGVCSECRHDFLDIDYSV